MTQADLALEIKNLRTHFFFDEGTVRAVDDVSLTLRRGKTLGVVGESGCGKSVTAQSVLQIVGAGGRIVDGEILLHRPDKSINLVEYAPTSEALRQVRGKDVAMIFQEPMTAFSPIYSVGWQIIESILFHEKISKQAARERVIKLFDLVGIPNAAQRVDSYPFELSGGMRQRAMIAMALSCNPMVLIADEPTTALDVTIQAQILELLRSLQAELGMAILIITHNMGVIAEMADEVAVMYLGKVVEQASVWDLFDDPQHPYTTALLKSIPMVEEEVKERLASIQGSIPDPYNLPPGCRFSSRCDAFMPGVCDRAEPPLIETKPGHWVRCFLWGGRDE
ncbi:MAG: ABC transporter ATP-binding protein [Caldilineaceae bacterium]|nr:ABC transporter ATP-binding protein [Caldilineaceae bacterium]